MLKICQVSGFFNRYRCITRIIRMYLLQDYEGPSVLLLYNNGSQEYVLDNIQLPPNKEIILINNNKELATGEPYKDTGTIFNDANTFIPPDVDVVCFGDTDDFYLPEYLSEGVKGYERAIEKGCLAYKPYSSWFKYVGEPVCRMHNTMEPSWTVNKEFLLEHGMFPVTASYHRKWIDKAEELEKAFVDPKGPAVFLYWWGGDDNVYKTSSSGDSPEAFQRLRAYESDEGINVLRPCSVEEIQHYYNIINYKIKE